MARIELRSLSKTYSGGVVGLGPTTLDIRDGELLVLVGPSGCGKSTLLRLIAGLESPSSGDVVIDGTTVTDMSPKDRDVAMVFQSYALYPHMTVGENIGFSLKLRKFSKAATRDRVKSAATLLGLADLLNRKPKALSGGQRQRVALGRALVREPKAFLLDEPLSNLDAALRVEMRTEIRALHRRLATTMVYVTHDQVEAMTLADTLVVMRDGYVLQSASPDEVYTRPSHHFVAAFIGSPPMNCFRGRCRDSTFHGPGFTLAVSASTGLRLPREIILGIRPEHLTLQRESASLRMTVDHIEPLGHATLCHGRVGEAPVVARVSPGTAPNGGDTLDFAVKGEHMHWFHADTGERVAAGGGQ